jgi:hypothetical protein
LKSPCCETPKNAIKKSNQTTEGGGEKNGRKKNTFFVITPDGFFRLFFLQTPLVTKRPKQRAKKAVKNRKTLKQTKNKMDAAADVRQFRHFVFCAPPCKRPLEMMALGPWFLVPTEAEYTR